MEASCHNFIQDTGYEIFRPDGTLRKSSFTDNKPNCEGSFSVEVKDRKGVVKSFEEHPVRSFQGGIIYALASADTSYRFINKWDSQLEYKTGTWWNSSLIGSDMYARYGGIFIGNISDKGSGTSTSYYGKRINANGADNYNNGWYASTSRTASVTAPHYDEEEQCIEFAMRRESVALRSGGSANGAGYSSALEPQNNSQYYTWFCDTVNSSWNQGDSLRLTYNFKIPCSASSTVTKNFISDLFGMVFWQSLKNIEGTNVNLKESNGNSYLFSNSPHIYGASTNQTTKGIVLSSSNADCQWDDYCIDNLIPTNDLTYGSTSVSDFTGVSVYPANNPTKIYCQHARNFTNISGHDIVIRKAGVYAYADNTTYSVASTGSFLIAHWLTGDVTVHNGETIRVYWKPTISQS